MNDAIKRRHERHRAKVYAHFAKKRAKAETKLPKLVVSTPAKKPAGGSSKISSAKFLDPTAKKAPTLTRWKSGTNVLDMGHNPSKSAQKAGANLLTAKPSKASSAGATSKWGPRGPYRMPKTSTDTAAKAPASKSFSAKGIGAAVLGAVALVTTGVIMKQQATNRVGPKRNKSKAVESAKARKPITTPKAPKIKLKTAADLTAAMNKSKITPYKSPTAPKAPPNRPSTTVVRPRVTTPIRDKKPGELATVTQPKQQKPRNITELESPKAPKAPVAPKAPEAPKVATPRVAPKAKSRGFIQGVLDAFRPEAEVAEERAARRATAPKAQPTEPAAITTPVDPPKEAKPQGRVKKIVTAPLRGAKSVIGAASDAAKTGAKAVASGVRVAAAPEAETAEVNAAKAAQKPIVTPVDKPKTPKVKKPRAPRGDGTTKTNKRTPRSTTEFEGLSPDQLKARRSELEASIETDRSKSESTRVIEATPQEAEEVKLRDLANAKRQAAEIQADIAKAGKADDGETPRTERRKQRGRRGPDRAKASEVAPGSREGSWPPGPKAGSRRRAGSDPRGVTTPDVTPEKDLAKQLDEARAENRARGGSESKKPKFPVDQKKVAEYKAKKNAALEASKSTKATPGPAVGNNNVTKVDVVTTPKISEKDKALKKAASAPADAAMAAAELEAAQAREVVETATTTSRSATSADASREAGKPADWKPWSPEKMAASTVEERASYQRELESILTPKAVPSESTPKEKAAAKKAAQKYYNDKNKRIEAAGSKRKGTSTAITPGVVDDAGKPVGSPKEAEVPVHKTRRPTDALIEEQGINVRQIPAQTAPEADAVSEDWDKKAKNREAARSPMAQAKLDAEALGVQISEAEARSGTIGSKMKAADQLARGETPSVELNTPRGMSEAQQNARVEAIVAKGGLSTGSTSGMDRMATDERVHEARTERREAADRRQSATRRTFSTRLTKSDAGELLEGEREPAGKKGTRRDKQPGGDRRQAGSTWKPVDIMEEVNKALNERPGGLPDRRGPTMLDLDVGELKDAAIRGDGAAKETLRQYQAELRGVARERRGMDTAPREKARLELDLERDANRTPESTSVWDKDSRRVTPKAQMNLEADLTPSSVYSGDPVRRGEYSTDPIMENTLERMNERIDSLEKRLKNNPNVMYQGDATLKKLKLQRDGLAQDIRKQTHTKQFPGVADYEAQTSKKERATPDVERRAHELDKEGRRTVQKTQDRRVPGRDRRIAEITPEITTPVDRRGEPIDLLSGDQRTAPEDLRKPSGENRSRDRRGSSGRSRAGTRRGPHTQRTGVTRVDVTPPEAGAGSPRSRPATWVAENPNMWSDSLTRAGQGDKLLTSPAIGSNLGENISKAFKKAGKNVLKGIGRFKPILPVVGGLGFGASMFAFPDVARAYVDATGTQQDRIKAAGGQALESSIQVAGGMALFTGGLKAAERITPRVVAKFGVKKAGQAISKAAVGTAGTLTAAASVGWVAGSAIGGATARVQSVAAKNKRDAAYSKKHYGTVEAATRTRKERNKTITLDEADKLAQRWEREAKKLKEKRNASS